jgi:hypothetical protein
MHQYNSLDTTITIMNSGRWCTSCWIYYKKQGFCEQMKAQKIESVAPGQAIRVGPGADADMEFPTPEVGSDWLGSAYITCNEPMGIIIDQLSHPDSTNLGTLLSMRAMPYDPIIEFEVPGGRKTWYADLLYREWSGWDSSIQVQNMTTDSMPTFVTVEFFNESGDSIFYLGDWVCRNGTATFYLPAIIDLGVNFPFGYVGAAEIESHYQVDYPGGTHPGEDIVAVVDIKKRKLYDEGLGGWRHTYPGETQGGAYNAHPLDQKMNMWGWAMPYIAKEQEGVTSRIVIRNNSNCTKIDGTLYIKDETGTIVAYIPVSFLHPKHMKVFDLNYFGQVFPGFVGAAEFWVDSVEQLCDLNGDGETDIEPVMPSVVVLNYGWDKELPSGGGAGPITDKVGDLARVYEAIPYWHEYSPCWFYVEGNVLDMVTLEPIEGVMVNGVETDSTGFYLVHTKSSMDPDATYTVTATKTGYQSAEVILTDLYCGDWVVNFELVPDCEDVKLEGTVFDKETAEVIPDAYVTVTNGDGTVVFKDITATTDANGKYSYADIPFDPNDTYKVCAGKYDAVTGLRDYREHCYSVYIPECGGMATTDFELHDEPKSKVLLYFGNGGTDKGAGSGEQWEYDQLATDYGPAPGKGYIVEYTRAWPTDADLDEYKLIVLLQPGRADDDLPDNGFTEAQTSQMGLFINNGGRVVLLTEHETDWLPTTDDYEVQNDLLDRLSIGIDITNISDTVTTYDREITPAPYATEFQPNQLEGDGLGTGFQQLTVFANAFKLYDDILGTGGDIVIAADKVGSVPNNWPNENECTGWDVIVVGDAEILDDQHLAGGWPENELFAANLIEFPQGPTCP